MTARSDNRANVVKRSVRSHSLSLLDRLQELDIGNGNGSLSGGNI